MSADAVCEVMLPGAGIRPRYCVVKLDEPSGTLPDIAARAGKVFGVYVFDANSPACGDSILEYECLFVESQFDADPHDHWLSVEINERDDHADPVRYFPCWQIDGMARIEEGELTEGVIHLGIEDEGEAFEYLRL